MDATDGRIACVRHLVLRRERPALYHLATKISVRAMKLMSGSRKRIPALPCASGWTKGRDLPAPSGKTFRELYQQRRR
jgi:L-lactate dehydrogenase complex protein LldF